MFLIENFRSKLIQEKVYENQKYLEKRKDELELIKTVTNQLKTITEDMKIEIIRQGEQIST